MNESGPSALDTALARAHHGNVSSLVDPPGSSVPGLGAAAWWLAGAAGVSSLAAAVPTFTASSLLSGPAVSIGNARGTAAVVAVIAVPLLVASMVLVARGSVRALPLWLAALVYLVYNSVLFLVGTPFNRLFLLYVAMFSLSAWALATTAATLDIHAVRFSDRAPLRSVAVFMWVVVVLNAMVWLRGIAATVGADRPDSFLDGSGMTTNPVYVQDLAIWLPLAGLGAVWLWQRRPWGALLSATVLSFWVLESIGIATDQWFGARADATTDFADASMTPVFLVAALVIAVPAVVMLRSVAPAVGATGPHQAVNGAHGLDRSTGSGPIGSTVTHERHPAGP